jgi:hypothetical protein
MDGGKDLGRKMVEEEKDCFQVTLPSELIDLIS